MIRKVLREAKQLLKGTGPVPRFSQLMQRPFELTPRDVVDIESADAEQQRRIDAMNSYAGDRAKIELRAARDRFAQDPSLESQKELERLTLDFPAAVEGYRQLRSAARNVCKQHAAGVLLPIAQRIFSRAIEQLDERLAELKAEESLVLNQHAIPYEPSPLARAVSEFRTQLETAHLIFESDSGATLKQTLAVLV
jgi:hypothetical protein